jgi:hypothetical protein
MRHEIARALRIAAVVAVMCGGLATPVRAEEGGSGHYGIGAMASFIDTLPGVPGVWGVANFMTYYDGSAAKTLPLPKDGQFVFGMHARAYVDTPLVLYQTKAKLLGGGYGVAVAIPIMKLEVEGTVTGPKGNTYTEHDSATGLGDIVVYPLMVVWKKNDLKYIAQFGVYAPTGAYEKGKLANLGKNYWTFEPAVAVSWISSKIGTEVTAYAGFDFNTRNNATDYLSGTSFHFDSTVAQHLPLGKDTVIGVGANIFYFRQITADDYPIPEELPEQLRGKLGGFEGRVDGVGPEISLITKAGKVNVVAELKWLPDSNVEHRVKGDTVWLKIAVGW